MPDEKFLGTKGYEELCVVSMQDVSHIKITERELSGVVYQNERTGPGTEPWGTRQVIGDEVELCGEILTVDVRDDRYEVVD